MYHVMYDTVSRGPPPPHGMVTPPVDLWVCGGMIVVVVMVLFINSTSTSTSCRYRVCITFSGQGASEELTTLELLLQKCRIKIPAWRSTSSNFESSKILENINVEMLILY